jgi:hypothetical protein
MTGVFYRSGAEYWRSVHDVPGPLSAEVFGFERLLSEGGGGTAAGLIPDWLKSSASLTIHPGAAIWHGQTLQHLLTSIPAYLGLLRTGHDLASWLMTSGDRLATHCKAASQEVLATRCAPLVFEIIVQHHDWHADESP